MAGISGFGPSGAIFESEGGVPARAATDAVLARLERGARSACIGLISDSTGTDTDEWFGIMGIRLGARFPKYTVEWKPWNDTTQDYDQPTVVQTGTVDSGAERCVDFGSSGAGGMTYTYSTAQTGDQDVAARVLPISWAPGGGAARCILSRYDVNAAPNNRGWYLYMDGTGHLVWNHSADGAALVGVKSSTAVVPFADGTAGWVRATLDVDNGATGHTVTFYTSVNGTSWTQLGTPVVVAGVTSVNATTTPIRTGHRNLTPTDFWNGKVLRVEYRPGTLGATRQPSVIPPLLDDHDQATTGSSVTFSGAPVLTLLCGAQSGQNLAYFDLAARRPKMLQPHGQQAVFLSTGHNEGNYTNQLWLTPLSTYITNGKALLPGVPWVLVTQNPTMTPVTAQQIAHRAARGPALMTWAAAQQGVYSLDTYRAFPADISTVVEVSDGIHPTQGDGGSSGSDLWANYAYNQLFA